MAYPDKKQITKKKEDLVRSIRHYLLGFGNAELVKNELKCLFTDIFLDEENRTEGKTKYGNFEAMIKKW